MPVKISHSARDMLDTCGEKYRLHYIERKRSPLMYSSLFFGNALDAGFSRILLEKKKQLTQEETELLKTSEFDIFNQNMQVFKHNNKEQFLLQNEHCEYYFSDFDKDLVTPKMEQLVKAYDPSIPSIVEFYDWAVSEIKAKRVLSVEDKRLYNYICWLSLVEKGLMMLQAYREQILPQIHEVYDIQKKVSLVNAAGDSISGAIDFTASFVDNPGRKYICDNKSSSKAYKANAVLESDQLATYCEAEGSPYAAYVVVQKTIYKKHPKIKTQIIKGEIKEAQLQETFDKFEQAVYTIEEKRFHKNKDACFSYGKKCPYYALCHYGKEEGLEDV